MRHPGSGAGEAPIDAEVDGLRVAQVSVLVDERHRDPESLLEAWFTLAEVAAAVAASGAAVTVVQAATWDAVRTREGVAYRFVRSRPSSGLRRRLGHWAAPVSRDLVAAVAEARPDVVHFHSFSFPRHAALLRQALPRTPIVIQDHADDRPPRWRRGLVRRWLGGVNGAVLTAPEHAARFLEAGLLPARTRVHVVPESSSRFEPGSQAEARRATGLHGDPCLVWLGNLDANKDPLTALEAVAIAARALPDVHLWCAYRGSALLPRVRARLARDPNLARRIHLLGPRTRPEVERLLRAADFLVQCSHREGSGYAVIEALACGTTPLVTRIPSFRALTDDGAVASLTPPGDAAALADAIVAWSSRDRAALRLAARRHFEEHLSFDVIGRKLVAAYRSVLGAAT